MCVIKRKRAYESCEGKKLRELSSTLTRSSAEHFDILEGIAESELPAIFNHFKANKCEIEDSNISKLLSLKLRISRVVHFQITEGIFYSG